MNNVILGDDSVIFQNRYFDIYTGELIAPIETPNYTVVQVAESYYLNAFAIASHRQICDLEITLPLTTGITERVNHSTRQLTKHHPYLVFSGDRHALSSGKSGRFQTLAINIKDTPCNDIFLQILPLYSPEACVQPVEITQQMSQIVAEFSSAPAPHFALQLDCLITEILIKLSRGNATPEAPNVSAQDLLPLVINFLDNHYLEPITAESICAKFGYTYSHICKIFKAMYQVSPGAYLHGKRMAYGRSCLIKGMSVSQVAEQLGYGSPFNFSRAYRKHFGVPPSAQKK